MFTQTTLLEKIDPDRIVQLFINLSAHAESHPSHDDVPEPLRDLLEQFKLAQVNFTKEGMKQITKSEQKNNGRFASFLNKGSNDAKQLVKIEPEDISEMSTKLSALAVSDSANKKVSERVKNVVDQFKSDQMAFVTGIDKYMHNNLKMKKMKYRRKNPGETGNMEIIIDLCPEFLAVKDENGYLPLHTALNDENAPTTVAWLAKEGIANGLDERGGILTPLTRDKINLLHLLAGQWDEELSIEIFKELMNLPTPLFTVDDVSNYDLLHYAVKRRTNDTVVKYLIDLNPSVLFHEPKLGGFFLPIACSNSVQMMKVLLRSAMELDPSHSSVGGLFAKDKDNELPLRYKIIDDLGSEATWTAIGEVLQTWKNVPIVQKVILNVPLQLDNVLLTFPHALYIRDENGRLPIHVALMSGMKWSIQLQLILNSNVQYLGEKDPITGLTPYDLAALDPSCDLQTMNYLETLCMERFGKVM